MTPLSYTKQPGEIIKLTFNCAEALLAGDSISSFTAKAYNSSGTDVSSSLIDSSSKTATLIYITIKDGIDNQDYKLEIKITTVLEEVIEDELKILVRET
jgi:hypothetical protein